MSNVVVVMAVVAAVDGDADAVAGGACGVGVCGSFILSR